MSADLSDGGLTPLIGPETDPSPSSTLNFASKVASPNTEIVSGALPS